MPPADLPHDPPCPLVESLPVLGVPVAFETNARIALERVRETWGAWASLRGRAELLSEPGATVRIVVDDAFRPAADPAAPSGRGGRPVVLGRRRLAVRVPGVEGEADADLGRTVVRVAPEALVDARAFAERVLEPLTLFLLGARDRQPVHAAAVVRDGVAVLLAGPSGAGKSTLAHAARRAGFAVLADEPVYVQTKPVLRVWGRRSRLHLSSEAQAHFPELVGIAPTPLPTGKTKLVLPGRPDDPRWADRAGICLLERAPGRPGGDPASLAELSPLEPAAVVEALTRALDPGYDLFADTIGEPLRRVAEGGAWTLRWSGGPDVAVALLERAARAVAERA